MEGDVPDIPHSFWKSALGCTVQVETKNKNIFSGRLYVVDPQTNAIVLVQENRTTVIIPGHTVNRVNSDSIPLGEHDISDFLDPLRKDTVSYNEEELVERKDKLKRWLTQNGLRIEDNEGILKCQDDVLIEPPYNEENTFCSNVILLERIRDVISKLPAD